MDTGVLAGMAGVGLSLLFAYVPGFVDWYEARNELQKRQVMLLLLAVAAVIIVAQKCQVDAACYGANWQTLLSTLFTAAVVNQGTYLLVSKGSQKSKQAKAKANEPK